MAYCTSEEKKKQIEKVDQEAAAPFSSRPSQDRG